MATVEQIPRTETHTKPKVMMLIKEDAMAIIADRIEVDPKILHGKPHVAGTRVPVDIILGLLADGLTPEEIIAQHYPSITKKVVLACLRYNGQQGPI